MVKERKSKEVRASKGIGLILERMDQQHNTVVKKLDEHDRRFDRLETAVMENGVNIKEVKIEIKELKNNVDVAVTNHEQRIRRLEEKVGT